MKTNIPELLAPAGSMNALKGAVNAGADAVYLAGKQFGARYYAANFDDIQLNEAIQYAHLRGVRVYVTVNTLIKDHELPELAKYLLFLYEIGVDAILVQDIVVARLAKKTLPDLNLHASTQMTIHNIEGAKWASQFGFKRIVLAREMELWEIEKIGENLDEIELEVFAHGALCYSYSGQCILSSLIGGRSGNRGMCAQPCRKPYDLILGEKNEYGNPINITKAPIKDKYLLSTRDLAIYPYLNEISKSSITSIKIEGRMRSPEYVAIVIDIYRKALDSIAKGKWKPKKEDINNLKFAFNREFTGGYILKKNVMGRNRPGNRGVYVGSLAEYKKKNKEAIIEVKNNIYPEKGDGIVIISPDNNKKEYGMVIHEDPQVFKNKVKLNIPQSLIIDSKVYITRRKSLIDKAQKIINIPPNKPKHPKGIDLNISIKEDGSILLLGNFYGSDNNSLTIQLNSDFKMQKAINKPLTKKTIENQFSKTGGTPFHIETINIQYPGDLFAPISKLNKLRRELFGKVEKEVLDSYCPSKKQLQQAKNRLNTINSKLIHPKTPNTKNNHLKLGIYVNDLKTLKGAVNGGCNRIYFEPFISNITDCKFNENKIKEILSLTEDAKSICSTNNIEFIFKLPKINPDSFLDSISSFLNQLIESGVDKFMVDGIGAASYLLGLEDNINLYASSGLNIWNHCSIKELNHLFKSFTISSELSKDEIKTLASNIHKNKINTSLELLVQGNIESIISKDCIPCILPMNKKDNVFFGIEDTKKRIFPLLLDNECHTYILNSVELCLIDYIPLISTLSIDTVTIDARGKTEKYAEDICSNYRDAIKITEKKDRNMNELKKLKNRVKKISFGGITTGNFIRGIKEK
ncbi:DUF3656 domain-containing U32 family peptidase [Methanobacterium oryzae]|uniref:DUF3656 domain-containing U32 family peptidase n=1 Tax=Methanobacterium oryzae TaxID=69540 RepID=UPI003D2526BB